MPVLRLRSISRAGRGPESRFSGPRVRIGRSRDNDLILPDKESPASSSHHAEALLDSSGAWWIVDTSAAGTLLNGVRASRQALKTGDRLRFGDEEFIVTIGGGSVRWLIGAALVAVILAGLLALVVVERRRGARAARTGGRFGRPIGVLDCARRQWPADDRGNRFCR